MTGVKTGNWGATTTLVLSEMASSDFMRVYDTTTCDLRTATASYIGLISVLSPLLLLTIVTLPFIVANHQAPKLKRSQIGAT